MSEGIDLTDRLVRALEIKGKIVEISLQYVACSSKVDFLLDLIKKENLLPEFLPDEKSYDVSKKYKDEGNLLFAKADDYQALEKYTSSLKNAPYKSDIMALGFANRSAALFRLKLYEECTQDIDRAIENNYPEDKLQKLLDRKEKAKQLMQTESKLPYYQKIPKIPNDQRNKTIECASDSVEIKVSSKFGRYVIASKDIQIGEIVVVEKPSFTLLKDDFLTHCYECLTLCYNLIPCEGCTIALFCSKDCSKRADSYHKYLCPLLKTIESLNFNFIRIITLKIALMIRKEYPLIKSYDNSKETIYKSGRYKEIHQLVTNIDARNVSNMFDRVCTSAAYYHLIKTYTNFLSDNSIKEDLFKDLLLHNLLTMGCNFHSIEELEKNNGSYALKELGCGAYAFASLFNHSCSPNIERFSYGSFMVLRAVETIKKGEELFENYGEHFAMHPKSKRQHHLKDQYFFTCECRPCSENWKTYDTLPDIDIDMTFIRSNFQELSEGTLKNTTRIKKEILEMMRRLETKQPNLNFLDCQEALKQIYNFDGNVKRVS